jgi:plastocyanin
MRSARRLLPLIGVALTALLALGAVLWSGPASASAPTSPTSPANYSVTTGWGDDDYTANIYTPHTIQIYVGDTVTWRNNSLLEPHTITFGPSKLLAQLAKKTILTEPQESGPPQLVLNPQAALPTRVATYDGTGFANSGLLAKGQRWSLAFTRPGVYHYHCLLHFPEMSGTVVVHPRPTASHLYQVRSGYGAVNTSYADAFFPDNLRIHVGETVRWSSGGFHTVAFAPASVIQQLRKQLILPVPQKNGPPTLVLNPKAMYPTGGSTYDGKGFWNSGLLLTRSAQLTFTRPGVYHYGCLIHPGMDGTITVLP